MTTKSYAFTFKILNLILESLSKLISNLKKKYFKMEKISKNNFFFEKFTNFTYQ